MRSKIAMTLAAIGAAVIISSAPAGAAPVTGSNVEATRAAAGPPVVEEVGRKYRRHYRHRRHAYRPRVYGFYGRPYRRFYGPRYYSPYYYGGYPYYYRRRPGIYFGFGF